jgi:hypothetical protein
MNCIEVNPISITLNSSLLPTPNSSAQPQPPTPQLTSSNSEYASCEVKASHSTILERPIDCQTSVVVPTLWHPLSGGTVRLVGTQRVNAMATSSY